MVVYLVAWFVLFLGSLAFRYDMIMWLDPWLSALPLAVSVLVGWLPLAIIVATAILSGTRSGRAPSRAAAIVAGTLALVLAVQTGMLVSSQPAGDPPTATGRAMQGGFFGAAGPLLIWTFLLMAASWLRDRIARQRVPFRSPRHLDARYLIGGGACCMLIGLAIALVVQR